MVDSAPDRRPGRRLAIALPDRPGPPTVGELLGRAIARLRAAGSELPRLDAELLLGHAAGLDRVAIMAHPEASLTPAAAERYATAIARRARGEPVAYIRGTKEFFGLSLSVDARALIPRPETERLVELGSAAVRAAVAAAGHERALRIADVGTGSGAVAIAVAAELRALGLLEGVDILATDRSTAALQLAATNVATHGLEASVRLAEADLLPPGAGPFDVLVANLPYVPTAVVPVLPVAASYEPREALDGGPDGLAVIRRLLARLPTSLAPGGQALLEIGADQGPRLRAAMDAILAGWTIRIELDLAGLPRIAMIERSDRRDRKRPGLERSSIPGPDIRTALARAGLDRSSAGTWRGDASFARQASVGSSRRPTGAGR